MLKILSGLRSEPDRRAASQPCWYLENCWSSKLIRVLSVLCQRRILHLKGFASILCPLCTFSISIFICVRVIWPKYGMATLKSSGDNAHARRWKLCAATKLSIQCLCTALFMVAHWLSAHKGFVVLLIFVGVCHSPSSLYFKDQLHAEELLVREENILHIQPLFESLLGLI